jgi:hypothetical protein
MFEDLYSHASHLFRWDVAEPYLENAKGNSILTEANTDGLMRGDRDKPACKILKKMTLRLFIIEYPIYL